LGESATDPSRRRGRYVGALQAQEG